MGTEVIAARPNSTRRRRAAILVTLLTVLIALAWWGGRQLWARHELREGQASLDREAFDEALRRFDRCLSIWPEDVDAHVGAARAARRSDNLAHAEGYLKSCQRQNPTNAEVALEAALVQAQRGGAAGLAGSFGAYLDHDCPEKYLILEALGKGFLAVEALGEAEDCLGILLRGRPDHFQGRLLRGRLYETLRREAAAVRDYGLALDLRPESVVARLGVARNLDRLGDAAKAGPLFEQVHTAQPENVEARLGLVRWYTRSARFADAHRLLDEAASPPDTPVLVERARLSLAERRPGEAQRLLEEALVRDGYCRPARLLLAEVFQVSGRTDEAARERARAGQLDADERRLPVLKTQINTQPQNVPLLFELGTTLLRLGQADLGERALQGVLLLEPGHAGARKALAELPRGPG